MHTTIYKLIRKAKEKQKEERKAKAKVIISEALDAIRYGDIDLTDNLPDGCVYDCSMLEKDYNI